MALTAPVALDGPRNESKHPHIGPNIIGFWESKPSATQVNRPQAGNP
jgi:hypothetical protein